jgi:hypothetical protein
MGTLKNRGTDCREVKPDRPPKHKGGCRFAGFVANTSPTIAAYFNAPQSPRSIRGVLRAGRPRRANDKIAWHCNSRWHVIVIFYDCLNFEQTVLKLMTNKKSSATNEASGGLQGQVWWSKSREEPRRAQAASPRKSRINPTFGEKGSTHFRAGPWPCSFFSSSSA